MLQRHCAKHIYIVPDGLKELMSDISREVLRSHPKNVYTFIADYLDALIITRENARVAAKLVQSITEITTTTCNFLKKTGISRKEADNIVAIIQKTFRQHLRECPVVYDQTEQTVEVETANIISNIINEAEIPPEIGEEAARIIQNAYKDYKHRREHEKELLNGMIDWRVAARSAIRLYRKTGVTTEEASRAANLIKSAYKGYYTRRIMKNLAKREKQPQEEKVEETSTNEETKSITKSDRSVRINYNTVIPHVDFDDVNNLDDLDIKPNVSKESTTSIVVADTINNILEQTITLVERKHQTEMDSLSRQEYKEMDGDKSGDSFNLDDYSFKVVLDDAFFEDGTENMISIDDGTDNLTDI